MLSPIVRLHAGIRTRLQLRDVVSVEMYQRDSYLGLVRDVTAMVLGLLPDLRVSRDQLMITRCHNAARLAQFVAQYSRRDNYASRHLLIRDFPQLGTFLVPGAALWVRMQSYGIIFIVVCNQPVHCYADSIITYAGPGQHLSSLHWVGTYAYVGNGYYLINWSSLFNTRTGVSVDTKNAAITHILPCGLAQRRSGIINMDTAESLPWHGPHTVDDYGDMDDSACVMNHIRFELE